MMKQQGFTLVEVIIFIVVTSILSSTMLIAFNAGFNKAPVLLENTIATQTAEQCLEWFVGQRQLFGYTAFSCPSTAVPAFCTAPTGYTIAVNIVCTTISGDTNYQNISVTVSGKGNATMNTLVANY
jgi:type II secretory pathway pseudopilin PulG